MTQNDQSRRSLTQTQWLALIWVTALILRVAFVLLEPSTRPVADETMWLMATLRIPEAHFSVLSNYPIFHPPIYPFFLAALHHLSGSLLVIKLAQALIGSLLAPAVFRVASRLIGERAAILSGLLAALYPELIWYTAHFWCETLFLTLLWWALERVLAADETGSNGVAAAGGALFGLAVLTRETVLYLLPLVFLWMVGRDRSRRMVAAVTLVSALSVVAPWTLRNWAQFDTFIPVSTGGGLNLYQGNAEISRGEVYNEYYANEGKVEQFRWARAEGIKSILRRQPGWLFEKIRDEGPRLAELDSLALIHIRRGAYGPSECGAYRGVAAIILLPWLLIALGSLMALARSRINRQSVFLFGLIAAYLLLHIATHGFSRYRLPVLPGFFVLAASLFEADCRLGRTPARRLLLFGLAVALALLWAPSLLDQLGHLGFAPPPAYEGFAPVCPA